jgi:hypothetical protein
MAIPQRIYFYPLPFLIPSLAKILPSYYEVSSFPPLSRIRTIRIVRIVRIIRTIRTVRIERSSIATRLRLHCDDIGQPNITSIPALVVSHF